MAWAVELHRGQMREGDGALPYATHPFDVLARLRSVGGVVDEDLWCAAMLHDVVEETDATFADIEKRFGERIAVLVGELTRQEPTEKERAGLDEQQIYDLRNRMLLEGIRKMSPDAMRVKLADRLANMEEATRTRSGKKLERYVRQTKEILAIIPPEVNPALWQAVDAARKAGKRKGKG